MCRSLVLLLFCCCLTTNATLGGSGNGWFWRKASDPDTTRRQASQFDSLLESTRGGDFVESWSSSNGKSITARLDLTGASLAGADLAGDTLSGLLLCEADLSYASLRGAVLSGAILSENTDFGPGCKEPAQFWHSDLQDCLFEPIGLPSIASISTAEGLRTLRWKGSNSSLVQLREELGKSGFRQQEREVICALRRHSPSLLDKLFLFDLFSEYGSNLSLLVRWVIGLWVICALCYFVFFFVGDKLGIWLIEPIRNRDQKKRDWSQFLDEKKENYVFQLKCSNGSLVGHWPNPRFARLPMWLRLLWWALFFSAISAFNIGFRDINFGRWLRLLTRRDFDLQPYGWVRVISGFQALISVYLVALWILSFAGTPFK
jgi:hypothetical protein